MNRPPADALHTAVRLRGSLSSVLRHLRARARSEDAPGSAHLAALSHLYRLGPMAPSALARHEGVKLQTLTRLLAGMEASGAITRTPDPGDGRQSVLALAPAGAALLAAEARRREAALADVLAARLAPAERAQLLAACALLDRLAEGLADAARPVTGQAAS